MSVGEQISKTHSVFQIEITKNDRSSKNELSEFWKFALQLCSFCVILCVTFVPLSREILATPLLYAACRQVGRSYCASLGQNYTYNINVIRKADLAWNNQLSDRLAFLRCGADLPTVPSWLLCRTWLPQAAPPE